MGYHSNTLLRFVSYALPLLILLLALFGFAVEILDVEPKSGSVIKLAVFDQPQVPAQLVFGTWLLEASGLLALFLLAQGRCGAWWLDGLVAGWLGWVFRGPLLVVTIVVAARQPHYAWWSLAFGWWVLYSVCGLSLSMLARRTELDLAIGASGAQGRHEKLQAQRHLETARNTEDAAEETSVETQPVAELPAAAEASEPTGEPPETFEADGGTEASVSVASPDDGGSADDDRYPREERQSPWAKRDEEP